MKKSALVVSTIIITAGLAAPVTASAGEIRKEITTMEYLKSFFSPAPQTQVVRPRKTKF